MLRIEKMQFMFPPQGATGEELFKENKTLTLVITAPIYWWVDCDWVRYSFNMPTDNFEFCYDEWEETVPAIRFERVLVQNPNLTPRALMQILPLSTYMKGIIELSYKEIVEICENYLMGEYHYNRGYSFPNEREWSVFCETLLDIKGVRDLMEDE